MKEQIYKWLNSRPGTKGLVHRLMIHPVKGRPRLWLRLFRPLFGECGKGSVIYRSARMDIAPFNRFKLGKDSVIEDFAVVNNLVGDIIVGDDTRIGIGNVLIGPVEIGNSVIIAQNVTISGLNHNYENITLPIKDQGVSTACVSIGDEAWIGANSVITPGVTVGKHSIVAAGSVVTGDVPQHCVVAGVPAKIIKMYNSEKGDWERV